MTRSFGTILLGLLDWMKLISRYIFLSFRYSRSVCLVLLLPYMFIYYYRIGYTTINHSMLLNSKISFEMISSNQKYSIGVNCSWMFFFRDVWNIQFIFSISYFKSGDTLFASFMYLLSKITISLSTLITEPTSLVSFDVWIVSWIYGNLDPKVRQIDCSSRSRVL